MGGGLTAMGEGAALLPLALGPGCVPVVWGKMALSLHKAVLVVPPHAAPFPWGLVRGAGGREPLPLGGWWW